MSDKTPTLAEVLEEAISGTLDDVRVALPGRIEAFNRTTRRATVQPLVMDRFVDENGDQQAIAIAPLTDVPVHGIGGSAEVLTFEIEPGDLCTLLFHSSSIARLKATGALQPADPGDDRHHHLSDAEAIPGLFLSGRPGAALIHVSKTAVHLGGEAAAQSALLGEAFLGRLNTLIAAIATAVNGMPGGATASGAITTALGDFNLAAATYKSSKVKVL